MSFRLRFFARPVAILGACCAVALTCETVAFASIIGIPSFGTALTENFNTLATTGTSSTLPAGWSLLESGTNADTTYAAGTGSLNTGNTYSFGAAASSDRALGTLLSGSLTSTIGAQFQNNTGGTITSLAIAYNGEQWRRAAARTLSPDNRDRLDFQYGVSATDLATGSYADVNTLDLLSTVGASATSGGLVSTTALSATISGLSIPNGTTFWIRWLEFNVDGSDDGLAVDDFSLTANGVLPPTGGVPEASALFVWSLLCGSVLVGANHRREELRRIAS